MKKIRVKNFGPIKEGNKATDGWLDVPKVTVFIGNQGSGKSTVAKLISSFVWLEKNLTRGDVEAPISKDFFLDMLHFHRLEHYLQEDSQIEFEGDNFHLKYTPSSQSIEAFPKAVSAACTPKIMYVPAERNFLSSIENINKVSDLLIGSLKSYAVEFRNAQLANKCNSLLLPFNSTSITYDSKDNESYLQFGEKRLKLAHASSGFHSFVPLFWITKNLNDLLNQDEKRLLELLSTDQTIRRNNELKKLNQLAFSEEILREKEKNINAKYISQYLINIVEEPEQNLFPSSQKQMLYSLLNFNNRKKLNTLIITTHSPYLLLFLTLSVEAHRLKSKLNNNELLSQLNEIVPLQSTLDGKDLVVYQLYETTGEIEKLGNYKGLPSDDNDLNNGLASANDDFSKLLDLEDACG